jgi:hypothetical protein
LREIDKVFVVACGTAYHSGLLAKYAIEHWTRLPVEVELASEFRHRGPVLDRSTLVVAISQSGETADTLEAVRHAKQQKAKVLAVCNTNGSQIPRECGFRKRSALRNQVAFTSQPFIDGSRLEPQGHQAERNYLSIWTNQNSTDGTGTRGDEPQAKSSDRDSHRSIPCSTI